MSSYCTWLIPRCQERGPLGLLSHEELELKHSYHISTLSSGRVRVDVFWGGSHTRPGQLKSLPPEPPLTSYVHTTEQPWGETSQHTRTECTPEPYCNVCVSVCQSARGRGWSLLSSSHGAADGFMSNLFTINRIHTSVSGTRSVCVRQSPSLSFSLPHTPHSFGAVARRFRR